MIKAFRLSTGPDGDSRVERGSVSDEAFVAAESITFKETPAHSSFAWHNEPIPHYIVTLTGTLEFATRAGETFTIRPGEVLIAAGHPGTGYTWRWIDDEPWKRAYVAFKAGADTEFIAERPAQS